MHLFFLTLALTTTLLFGASLFFAIGVPDRLYHFYFGLVGAVSCLLTHCWIFFYFIGTGQGIREAVIEYKLDERALKLTRKFKGRTFPFALFSMVFVIVGSVLGGALRAGRVSTNAHLGWIFFAIAFNLWSFRQEYRAIQENRELTARLDAEIGKATAGQIPASNP